MGVNVAEQLLKCEYSCKYNLTNALEESLSIPTMVSILLVLNNLLNDYGAYLVHLW